MRAPGVRTLTEMGILVFMCIAVVASGCREKTSTSGARTEKTPLATEKTVFSEREEDAEETTVDVELEEIDIEEDVSPGVTEDAEEETPL